MALLPRLVEAVDNFVAPPLDEHLADLTVRWGGVIDHFVVVKANGANVHVDGFF